MYVTSGIQFIWVRLFVQAWHLHKGFVVIGFLVSTGAGGAIGVVLGPARIDMCGGFDTHDGRSKSMALICKFMVGASLGASMGLFALGAHLESLLAGDASAVSGNAGDYLIYVFWGGMFIM